VSEHKITRKFARFWKRCSLRLWMIGFTASYASVSMAATDDGQGLFAKLADWLWAVALAAVGIIYKTVDARFDKYDKRIESLESRMPSDYERKEIDRQRDNITKIFDRLDTMQQENHKWRDDAMATMNKNHHELVERIADMTRG